VLTVIEMGWTLDRYLQEGRVRELLSDRPRRVLERHDFLRVLYDDLDMLVGPGGYDPVGVLGLAEPGWLRGSRVDPAHTDPSSVVPLAGRS
jgi:hypothetical protein